MNTNLDKKNILITGGAGFVGHHCIDHILKNTDWNVIVLDSLNYAGNMNRITSSDNFDSKRVRFIWHDLRSPITDPIAGLIGNINYLIHFAAESHVDRSLENSIPFVTSNVVGTANLLEYLKKDQPQCRTIIFSTDEVFGSAPEGIYFKENDSFRPSNPYAASKAGEEMIAFSFAHAFKLPIGIVRSMNIIGERQHPEKFVPKVIRAILAEEKIYLHGTSRSDVASRCWIHARTVADALLFLMDRFETGEFYHIVGEERTVLDVADLVAQTVRGKKLEDSEIQFVEYPAERPGYDKRYALSGDKLSAIGWKPPVDLDHSLEKTIKWTLENDQWLKI